METETADRVLFTIRERLRQDDVTGAIAIIESLLPPDQADLFEDLDLEEQVELLPELPLAAAANILEEMEDAEAAELAGQVEVGTLAEIVDQMESDEAADLLGDLTPEQTTATLAQMREADDVRPLLVHLDESAGGQMTADFWVFLPTMRVDQVLATLRRSERGLLEIPCLYVADAEGRLLGEISIYDLLRGAPETTLESMMDREVRTVRVSEDQEVAARLMARYGLQAVPVVDEANRLVGVITADDLVDVLEDEVTEDIQRIGGSQPLAQPYLRSGVRHAVWRRLGWLVVLLLAMAMASPIISLFEAELEEAIVLTFFIPMLMGTGGNAGSQTIATVVRALAVGDVTVHDAGLVLWRELRTAAILGLLLALVALPIALIWGELRVGLAVSVSILAVVLWANVLGALLPLGAARLKLDPALVSGPLLTTIIDVTALLIYFSLAGVILGL